MIYLWRQHSTDTAWNKTKSTWNVKVQKENSKGLDIPQIL